EQAPGHALGAHVAEAELRQEVRGVVVAAELGHVVVRGLEPQASKLAIDQLATLRDRGVARLLPEVRADLGARPRRLHVAEVWVEPVARGLAVLGRDDLDSIA